MLRVLATVNVPRGVGAYALGTALAVIAALLFAVGSVVQHNVATSMSNAGTLSWRRLLVHGTWLGAQAATIGGSLVQLAALAFAPVAIVQPLLAGGLVIALGIRAVADRRWPRPVEILGAVLATGGLAVFLVAARPSQGSGRSLGVLPALVVAGVTVLLIVATALLARGRHAALICGVMTGLGGGIAAVLASAALDVLQHHGVVATLATGSLWGAIATGTAALYISQVAFGRGPLASSLPAMTVVDPLVAVVAASVLLGEHLSLRGATVWGPAAIAAGIGVVLLAITESPEIEKVSAPPRTDEQA